MRNHLLELANVKLFTTPKILNRSYALIVVTMVVFSAAGWSSKSFAENNSKKSFDSTMAFEELVGGNSTPEPIPEDLIEVSQFSLDEEIRMLNSKSPADYDKAIELDPRSAISYFRRGVIYRWVENNKAKALDDFLKAKELGYPVEPQLIDGIKNLIEKDRQEKRRELLIVTGVRALFLIISSGLIWFLVWWFKSEKRRQLITKKIDFVGDRSRLLQTSSFLSVIGLLFFALIGESEDIHIWLTLIIFFVSVIIAVKSYIYKLINWSIAFAFNALLFNPMFKYRFDENAWKALYALSGIFFFIALFKLDLQKIKTAAKE